MSDTADLSALIASRICHDLISPIGAIGNGVELLTLERGGSDRPEFALIAESVANANARIRFFRVSFGAASGEQRLARTEVLSILTDLGRAGRITYAWTSQGDLSRRDVRLVFLLLQCLETFLPYGGRVEVTEGATSWTLRAEAQRMKIDPALWDILTIPDTDARVEAGHVHFALARRGLAALGKRLQADISPTEIRLTV